MRRLQREIADGVYGPEFTEIGIDGTALTEWGVEHAKKVNSKSQVDFVRELAHVFGGHERSAADFWTMYKRLAHTGLVDDRINSLSDFDM